VLALVAGCGGGDDWPDLAAPTPDATTESAEPASHDKAGVHGSDPVRPAVRGPARLLLSDRGKLAEQVDDADAAVGRWNESLDSCLGPSVKAEDPGALCTREAREQLFKQMHAVQYELPALQRPRWFGRMPPSPRVSNRRGARIPCRRHAVERRLARRAAAASERVRPRVDRGRRPPAAGPPPGGRGEVFGMSSTRRAATLGHVSEADGKPLDERLQEIGAQLAWVRDYL
jgi:hypothetical protein